MHGTAPLLRQREIRVGGSVAYVDRPSVGLLGPREKPHICFVAPYAWPILARASNIEFIGGAEVQQSILARNLAKRGYRVSMICLDFGQPPIAEVDGVTVHRIYNPDAGIPALRFIHPRITSIWRAMRKIDADVYYQRCSGMLTAMVAAFCKRHGKKSMFAGASDLDFLPGRQPVRFKRDRWLFEWGLKNVDAVVVQNMTQLRDCRANYQRDATLVPSCYELSKRENVSARDRILWVASIRERDYKRPELFLDLARRLPHRRFVMVGGSGGGSSTNSHFERVKAEAAALPNVEFKGFLPLHQVERCFDEAHVLVNTSLYEGMPNTFLQAWARGIPTVAFVDIGARVQGKPLYRTLQRTDEAVAEIERLFTDGAYWTQCSARSSEYFEASHSTSKVIACFERLLSATWQGGLSRLATE